MVSAIAARSLNKRSELGVGDVSRVPCQQEIDRVKGRGCDVNRIRGSPARKLEGVRKGSGQLDRLWCDFEQRQFGQNLSSPCGGHPVTDSCLSDHRLRHVHEKRSAPAGPPLARNLLAGRRHEIPTRTRRQVTDNRRFKVHGTRHVDSLALWAADVTGGQANIEGFPITRPRVPARSG
jgi:hypothetical protein